MTESVRSQVRASEMRFLRKIKGVTLLDKVRNTAIRESLNIESLLFLIKRFLRWFGHVSRMSQEWFPKQTFPDEMSKNTSVERSRTR